MGKVAPASLLGLLSCAQRMIGRHARLRARRFQGRKGASIGRNAGLRNGAGACRRFREGGAAAGMLRSEGQRPSAGGTAEARLALFARRMLPLAGDGGRPSPAGKGRAVGRRPPSGGRAGIAAPEGGASGFERRGDWGAVRRDARSHGGSMPLPADPTVDAIRVRGSTIIGQ